MSEKDKKFYWLKLKSEFMNGDVVDFLMSQKNGANYVVLYQMLCMKTINTQGELATKIGDVLIPFNIDKIQRECKWFDVDTIRVAMEMYRQLGLLYEQENGIIKISNFQEMVGSETYWAKQKRIERNEQKELLNSGVGQKLETVQKPLISKSNNLLSNNKEYNNFSDRIKEGIQTWLTYKREKGQTYKQTGLTKLINAIKEGVEKHGEQAVVDSIDNCIANNYTGLFINAPKTYTSYSKKDSKDMVIKQVYTEEEIKSVFRDVKDIDIDNWDI